MLPEKKGKCRKNKKDKKNKKNKNKKNKEAKKYNNKVFYKKKYKRSLIIFFKLLIHSIVYLFK